MNDSKVYVSAFLIIVLAFIGWGAIYYTHHDNNLTKVKVACAYSGGSYVNGACVQLADKSPVK